MDLIVGGRVIRGDIIVADAIVVGLVFVVVIIRGEHVQRRVIAMFGRMRLQLLQRAESALAELAHMGQLAFGMAADMHLEIVTAAEHLWALWALEGLLACVRALVLCSVRPIVEGLVAVAAGVWLVARMHALVLAQSRAAAKHLVTVVAVVRLLACVHARMALEVRAGDESLVAMLALERFLTSVCALVRLQVPFLDKLLGAIGALMALVARVQALVGLEIAELAEALATILTLERLLSGVHTHVGLEVAHLAECLLARGADVRLRQREQRVVLPLAKIHVRILGRKVHNMMGMGDPVLCAAEVDEHWGSAERAELPELPELPWSHGLNRHNLRKPHTGDIVLRVVRHEAQFVVHGTMQQHQTVFARWLNKREVLSRV
eukprot:m.241464 g.241464  ORF g.241464 m.241464 type:complete len:378 (+) comp13856_c0_seq1:484-1617(+)